MYYLTMIIPVFNSDDCLDVAVNSVINQTIGFENIELIIVDDCSTDNTRDMIKDYEEKYPNIKGIFLHKNNGGAGIPRNIGIKDASSKYLMFMDADDEYEKDACEIFYNKIVKRETGFRDYNDYNIIQDKDVILWQSVLSRDRRSNSFWTKISFMLSAPF